MKELIVKKYYRCISNDMKIIFFIGSIPHQYLSKNISISKCYIFESYDE
jgi:hypothetical protein